MTRAGTLILGLAATVGAAAVPILARSADSTRSPQQVWDATCHACHDGGSAPVILGKHLAVDHIKDMVRNGGLEMLPFTTAQISDAELDVLAQWVSAHDAPAGQ